MIHKLIQSFAGERGGHEMKETILDAKYRLGAFYVTRFEELIEQFLSSMKVNKVSLQVLESCCNSNTADNVFGAISRQPIWVRRR